MHGRGVWIRMDQFIPLFTASTGPSPALLITLLAAGALFIAFVILLIMSSKDG